MVIGRSSRGGNFHKIMGSTLFKVEKKVFEVKFEGIHGGPWISVTERFQEKAFSVAFEEEEVIWIME